MYQKKLPRKLKLYVIKLNTLFQICCLSISFGEYINTATIWPYENNSD